MCNCIKEVDDQMLKMGRNTKLDIPIAWSLTGGISADRVLIATCKRDNKKREGPLKLTAAFCPFCGKPYPEEPKGENQ